VYTFNSKIFFLADILFLGSSNIRVVLHSGKYSNRYIYLFIYGSLGLCSYLGLPAAKVGSSQMCLNGQYADVWWLGHKWVSRSGDWAAESDCMGEGLRRTAAHTRVGGEEQQQLAVTPLFIGCLYFQLKWIWWFSFSSLDIVLKTVPSKLMKDILKSELGTVTRTWEFTLVAVTKQVTRVWLW